MENSTPLSQLQQMKESNVPAATSHVPAPPEIQEDEKAVSDTLSQFQFSAQNKMPPSASPAPMQNTPHPSTQNMNDDYADMTNEDYETMMLQNAGGMEPFEQKKDLLTLFRTKAELKRMLIVITVFIIVTLIPVQVYLQQYIDLSRFPYAGLLLKGLLAGVMYMILYSLF